MEHQMINQTPEGRRGRCIDSYTNQETVMVEAYKKSGLKAAEKYKLEDPLETKSMKHCETEVR